MTAASRSRSTAWALALLSLIAGGLFYAGGVLNALGQQAEASVLEAASFTYSPPPPLNLVSIPAVAIALVLIGGVALAAHGVRRSVAATLTPVAAIVASQLLKQQFLQRPGLFELDAPNTFPSGHMTVFAALTGALVWAVPAGARAFSALAGAIVMAVAACQLIGYGWHRPSDVLGALALCAFAFAVASLLSRGEAPATSRGSRGISSTLAIGGFALAILGIAVAAVALLAESSRLMLLAGAIGLVGASFLTARAFLLLNSR